MDGVLDGKLVYLAGLTSKCHSLGVLSKVGGLGRVRLVST